MFGPPIDQPEFTMEQPTFTLPTTTPPIIAAPPQDQNSWNDWMGNWDLQRSDLGDLPAYPSPDDSTPQPGNTIRKTWHDVHKNYAFNTIQENFPDLDISQPQPGQSYHDFFNNIRQEIEAINPFQMINMQPAVKADTPLESEIPLPPQQTISDEYGPPFIPRSLRGVQPTIEQNADFRQNLAYTLGEEGGYNNDPDDPGGETHRGISDNFYRLFLNRDDINKSNWPERVTDLTDEQRDLIYRSEFYFDRNYHLVNDNNIRKSLFDAAVNTGPNDAEKFSAEALREMYPSINLRGNNIMGPKHRAAINRAIEDGRTSEYLDNFANARETHNNNLPERVRQRFGRGLRNRNERLRPND